MIPHGQATHDFFNLELCHHQYDEIIVIESNIYVEAANIYAILLLYKYFLLKIAHQ